ncbi:LytTR family DNA-binding domain-containing protein [Runella sp.]|uniref:LytR/AlgR family response regulator transcription factor n=1 Tax=Runella sp. TaxID=1960881 RepID=UPI002630A331|nr:LytTR family DNA-binding domain-containing protein [Runella sp.]
MTAVSNPITGLSACLSLLGGHYQLLFEEIVFIEGQGNYTVFHSRHGQPILTSKSLSFYRDKLPAQLLRIHKSYFANLLYVKAFDGEFVYLTDGKQFPVSRRRRREVEQWVLGKSTIHS